MNRGDFELLRHVPQTLLDDLVQGRWLPFIGAGFSKNAKVAFGKLPLAWDALGREIAKNVPGLGNDFSPLESLSAYEHAFSRVDLVDKTAQLIRAHDARPGDPHLAFAKVGFTNVVTTNFDFLLEKAYDVIGKGCLPVVDEVQLSTPNRYGGPRLIKLHGDVHHPDRLVITEDDYDHFLVRYPLLATSVTAMLVDHTSVLIGYSLDDPDTRQLLALIKNRLGRMRRPLWTVQFGAAAHIVARYERRGVKVINLPVSKSRDIGQTLRLFFEELASYWEQNLSLSAESSDDRITADLRVPDEPSRICFFAIPTSLYGWYREVVYPVVEARGYVPVVSRDVISSPSMVPTKVDALISRAALVVVEHGEEWQSYEASVAIQRQDFDRVLFVTHDSSVLRPESMTRRTLVRPSSLQNDPAAFLRLFDQWVLRAGPPRGDTPEPERLLEKKEYWAAVVSAVSLLETTLAKWVADIEGTERRVMPIRAMLKFARAQNLMQDEEEARSLDSAVTLRNEVLHHRLAVTATEARGAVSAIRRFVDRLAE